MNLGSLEKEAKRIVSLKLSEEIKPKYNILEVGCGDAYLLKSIASQFRQSYFVGIDPCVIPFRYENVELYSLGAENIDKLKSEFDIIFSVMSLHHFLDKDVFMRSVYFSLAKAGKLIVIDWKQGVCTGINENYFSLENVKNSLPRSMRLIEAKEFDYFFEVFAVKDTNLLFL